MSTRMQSQADVRPGSDEGNFRYLVRLLARNLNTKVAFICELSPCREKARTLALAVDGAFLESLEYKVAGTPCEAVYREGTQHVVSGLPGRFPEDPVLVEWQVDSYVGVPFFDSDGQPMGHVGIMNEQPIEDRSAFEALLGDCAAKASAELQRQRGEAGRRRRRR